MNRYRLFFMSILVGSLPSAALACACCADPGTRFEDRVELSDWVISEIQAVTATGAARMYQTACGMDCVAGINDPRESYPVQFAADEDALELRFDGAGSLRLGWPETYTWFGADADLSDSAGPTWLYTELRLRGSVSGTGDFAETAAVPAELVLSGTGNLCVGAASFQNWTLSVAGEGVSYRLFGTLD